MLAFPPATLQCCCFYGNYFLFNKRSLKSVGLNPILGRSICSFSRGSSAGADCSWLSLLQGCGVSKSPSQRPFLVIPPHISTFWFSSDGSCQSKGTVCTCCVLQGISVSLQGKSCLAKEVGESQTRLIHLQIMQRAAFGGISFLFPFFVFSQLKKNKCQIPVEAV